MLEPAYSASPSPLQLWGGVECSVVRIGGAWRDQVRETGHHDRAARDPCFPERLAAHAALRRA